MTAGASQRLSRRDRLRKRRDYERVAREGMRVSTPCFLVLLATSYPPGRDEPARLGVTVSRRVGGSVTRSKVKRHIREWFRRGRTELPTGRDLVVIARPGAAELAQAAVVEQLAGAAAKIQARNRAATSARHRQ